MHQAVLLSRFHLHSMWNWRTAHYSRLVEAPAYFAFMVVGLRSLNPGVTVGGVDYADFAYAGVLVVVAIRVLFWTMGDVANDRKWGVYAISRLSDVSFGQYVGSLLIANGSVAFGQLGILLALKQVLGFGSGLADVQLALLAVVIALIAILGGCALGFAVHSYHMRDMLTSLLSLPLVLTAPLFYSLDALPVYMRVLAYANPFSYAVLTVRYPITHAGGFVGGVGLAVCVVVAVVALARVSNRHELMSFEQG
jgi:ABC-2 type transport system permease protein